MEQVGIDLLDHPDVNGRLAQESLQHEPRSFSVRTVI
jgi:hypothetical protein